MECVEDSDVVVRVLGECALECPACGYDLRGLRDARCPECNLRLVLRVGLAEPRVGWFVAGLVGIAAGLGFCGLLLVWFVYMSLSSRGGPPWSEALPLPIGVVLSGGLLWCWVVRRGRLARCSDGGRLARVAMAWALGLACPVVFMATVR